MLKRNKNGSIDKRTKEGKEFYSSSNQIRGRLGCLAIIIIILIVLFCCGVITCDDIKALP